jgi:hypothetical protein
MVAMIPRLYCMNLESNSDDLPRTAAVTIGDHASQARSTGRPT